MKTDLVNIETIIAKAFAKFEQQFEDLFQKCSGNPPTDNDSETTDNDSPLSDDDSDASIEMPGMRQSDYDMEFVPTPSESQDYDSIFPSSPEPDVDFAERRDHVDLDFCDDSGIMTQSAVHRGQLVSAPPNKSILRPVQTRHLDDSAHEKPQSFASSKEKKKWPDIVRLISKDFHLIT